MIRLEKVTKHYGEVAVVDELSFEIRRGEVCVIIGPSGCGKTTTLRMINRLTKPDAGRIFINGKDTADIKVEQLRLSIGYAIQSVGLFPHMTVAGNIAVVPQLLHWEKPQIARRIQELLELVGLEPNEYADKYPAQLSGGEAQRIGVARALAVDPPIMLMDEPFGAVDPLTRERLQSQFVLIQQEIKKTIVLVTHDLDEAIRLADRIVIMENGRLIQHDTPEAILSRPKNKFVRDFIGADRALKKLSRIKITGFIKPAATVQLCQTPDEAGILETAYRWFWVVDENRRLIGWLDKKSLVQYSSISEAMDRGTAEDIALPANATLRDALSRMLGLGFNFIPVINKEKRLIGELSLGEIEAAITQGEYDQ